MNKQELIKKLQKLLTTPSEISGYDFDYGHDFGVERAISLAEDLDESVIPPELEKPVVPQYVADMIIEKKKKYGIVDVIKNLGVFNNPFDLVVEKQLNWIVENQEDFAKAWLYGYEIEKEKLYTVAIPDDERNGFIQLWKNREGKLLFNFGDKIRYGKVHLLTEQEIKQKDERLWEFAKEV